MKLAVKPSADEFLDEKPSADDFLDQKPSADAFLDQPAEQPDRTASLASQAIDFLTKTKPAGPVEADQPNYPGNKAYDPNASPVDQFLHENLIKKPEEAAPIVRNAIADKLAGSMSGQPDVPNTEASIVEKAQKTGQVPYADIINRVIAQSIPDMIPLTPVEISKFAGYGKAIDVGLGALAEVPAFQKPLSELPKLIQDWVMTKPKTVEVTPQALRDFFVFGREKLDPQTYDFLTGMPKEDIVDMIKARQGTSFETRVPRFGGAAEAPPAAEALKPGAPSETGNLPAGPEPILSPQGSDFLRQNHPGLATVVDSLPHTVDPDVLKQTILEATTKANAAAIQGASPAEAQATALSHFADKMKSGELAPQPTPPKPVKLDNQGVPVRRPGSVVSTVDLGDGQTAQITHQMVVNEAHALLQDDLNSREISPLEQFVKRYGGVKGYKGGMEGEEFKGVPVHLRGAHPVDEMAQMAYDRGLLDDPSGDLLREKLKEIVPRGQEPRIGDFYDQAVRNLEYYANEGVPLPQHGDVPIVTPEENLQRAKQAAETVLKSNKIDDRVMVNLVNHIAVDDQAFQQGYGKAFKPNEFEVQGATYTPGMRDRVKSVIELANGADEGVGRHEAFHAVSNILLDEGDQQILLDKYGDMEKAADAFGAYRKGAQAETPILQRIFQKIKDFLERISNYFKAKKFKTADDLFKDIEEGNLKGRGRPADQPQYSADENSLENKVVKSFGLTDKLKNAGFVLPDGKMIDFAGGGDMRLYSHHEAIEDTTKGSLYDFMGQTKALRVVHYNDIGGEHLSFQSMGPLSTDQLNQIRDYFDANKVAHSNLEKVDGSGHTVGRTMSVDKPTIEDISRFFNGSSQYKAVEKPFFSQVEKTVNEKMPIRAAGDQVMGMLRNSPGVKQEELDWIGLPEFLKGKSSVSKEEVQNFIKENNVQVQEVMKGSPATERITLMSPAGQILKKYGDLGFDSTSQALAAVRENSDFVTRWDLKDISPEELSILNNYRKNYIGNTKFDKYTLPGGENYRELLLTLPQPKGSKIRWEFGDEVVATYGNRKAIIKKEGDQFYVYEPDGLLGNNAPTLDVAKKQIERYFEGEPGDFGFRSSHFSEPNILAHVRFNDRYTSGDGTSYTPPQKTLFIEEIQSDWHQKGRERGYRGNDITEAERDELNHLYARRENWIDDKRAGDPLIDPKLEIEWTKTDDGRRFRELVDKHHAFEKGLPDAPFKKTWHELALKRMLRYAAENGYDKLAWTTGEQQAERYDLSKEIGAIDYKPHADGEFKVEILSKGMKVLDTKYLTSDKLSDFVGKDVANRIIKGEGEASGPEQDTESWKRLSGLDLKVGGEGMKGFYDQIIPSFLNKYAKKWGGRVGEAQLGQRQLEIEFDDRAKRFEVYELNNEAENPVATFETKAEAENYVKTSGSLPVHSLDITPAMKESVMKEGQPLYKAVPVKDISTTLRDSTKEIRDLVNPSKAAPLAAAITREQLGKMARSFDKAEASLSKAHEFFESQSVANNTDFIDKMEHGQIQPTPELQQIATQLRQLLDGKRAEVQALGTGKLKSFIENYFPHLWDQGEKQVSNAAKVLSKRPMEGGKSFLKKRTIEYFKDGIEAGLTPASYNPIDLTFLKIREMDKYIMAHKTIQEFKGEGLATYVPVGKDAPEGWIRINDNIATVFKSPMIALKEAFDKHIMDQLNQVAKSLEIEAERKTSIGGSRRWGVSYSNAHAGEPGNIATKFGGPESVLAHEIGHQLDDIYGLQEKFMSHSLQPEFRKLADLRFEGQAANQSFQRYVRKASEKMAVMLESYIHAPAKFKQVAPTLFKMYDQFLKSEPKLKPLTEIKPSLVVGTGTSEIYAGGNVISGHIYAQPDAARIINNYLSPGLQKSEVYKAYRFLGNAINQFQLGFSAFHLGFTSVDSMVSKLGLAINQLSLGHPVRAVAAALQVPIAPIENIIRGDKLLRAWKGQGSVNEIVAEAMAIGGGRAKMDTFYATRAYDQMKKFFKAGKYVKGILEAPFAAMEASSKPILEYIVPRQKLGVFADIINMELKHNPDMTHEELRSIAQKAWDSVDNRMGQLVYDNLFWNRTFKDLLMASVRSVGWNLGTIREVGGGIKDLGQIGRGPKGRGANVSYRTSYLAALPILVGIGDAIYQYLRTGKGPQELKDYYFPRTGSLDANGDPNRVSLPSYMKDLYHYTQHPVTTVTNKLNPLIAMVAQMLNNKDFFGVQIRNEDDPFVRQVAQEAQYILKQLVPFGIRNAQKNMQSDKELRDIVEPFIGITPAPYDVNQTKAEELAHRIAARHIPIGGRTQEQADRSRLLRDFSKRLRLNDPTVRTDMFQAMRTRQVSPLQIARVTRESHLTPLQRQVHSFSAEEIKKVYDVATPEEKKQIEGMMKAKLARSQHFAEQP